MSYNCPARVWQITLICPGICRFQMNTMKNYLVKMFYILFSATLKIWFACIHFFSLPILMEKCCILQLWYSPHTSLACLLAPPPTSIGKWMVCKLNWPWATFKYELLSRPCPCSFFSSPLNIGLQLVNRSAYGSAIPLSWTEIGQFPWVVFTENFSQFTSYKQILRCSAWLSQNT